MDPTKVSLSVLKEAFPHTATYREPRVAQVEMLEFISKHGACLLEAGTGTGKTAVEYATAQALRKKTDGTTFIVTPSKTILEQIRNEFPDVPVVMGRNEYPCLYYDKDKATLKDRLTVLTNDPKVRRADEIACSLLMDCPHRVYQDTGETHEKGACACPYLQKKYEAKQGRLVLSTMSFYLFTHLFSKEFNTTGLIMDEVHRFPDVVRAALSYDITDQHVERSEEILKEVSPETALVLKKFRNAMCSISVKKNNTKVATLLTSEEIFRLIDILKDIDLKVLGASIRSAVKSGQIDPEEDVVTLKKLETLARDIRRYVSTLEYSVPTEHRKALNYTCAFHRLEKGERGKWEHKLVIKCWFVAGIIKHILPPTRVGLSATIGDPQVFGFETGIKDPFLSIKSNFSAERTRLYMPTDTANLAANAQSRGDLSKSLRQIAKTCVMFGEKGIRSLVVTISNTERDKFLMMAEEESLDVVSYGNGVTAKQAALDFRDGKGITLVGTAANYAEGVDLPKQVAPVIFFLRPGYPNPEDPAAQFEEMRYGGQRWALWNARVTRQALQVRGRNIRSRSDTGVTFFISQQFRRFVFGGLPEYLKPAYRGQLTFDQAVKDALKLLLDK